MLSYRKDMKKVKATWSFSLDCTCPQCNADFNLDDMNGYSYVSDIELIICEQDTPRSTNIEVVCYKCSCEFLVDCQY